MRIDLGEATDEMAELSDEELDRILSGADTAVLDGGAEAAYDDYLSEWAGEILQRFRQTEPVTKSILLHEPEATEHNSDRLLDLLPIRQGDDYSCGAACAMAVGCYFSAGPDTLEEWKEKLGTNVKTSTRPQAIVDYLSSLGLQVESRQGMTIDDLREYWRRGMPIVVPLQEYGVPSKQASYDYGHYCVVTGVGLGHVFVFDPSIENVITGDHEETHGLPDELLAEAQKYLYLRG